MSAKYHVENGEFALPAPPEPGFLARAREAVLERTDEAVRLLEARRYQRILRAGRLPAVFSSAVFFCFWAISLALSAGSVEAPNSFHDAWLGGLLLTTTAGGAILAAYLRAQYVWNQERRLRSVQSWLLTRQEPTRLVVTTVVMSALLGLGLVAIPAVTGLGLTLLEGAAWWQLGLELLLLPLCALLGAALGVAAFFVGNGLARRVLSYGGLLVLAALGAGIWLRVEFVQHGWARGWGEHAARVATAILAMSPAPSIFGASCPGWWHNFAVSDLGLASPIWKGAFNYALFLLATVAWLVSTSISGYRRLAEDPDALDLKPRSPSEDLGVEYYWKGFRNPVLTREIRTRLRSKDTAEFLFFASIAVAAGAFVPLIMTTSDLSDPLKTAYAAREVFFWLTMTLVALVSIVTPGLTSDVITQERNLGTLEMLVGTPLRPKEILSGKLLGAACVMTLLISPSLPLFGLCYLFHGASAAQVCGVYLLLLVTLSVSALIGLTQSAINARSGVAKFWAYAVTAVFVGFPGGSFWVAACIAAADAQARANLAGWMGVTAVVAVLWTFVLALFWGNASEQLEYSEY